MSNLETAPRELACTSGDGQAQLLTPRDAPLGGPRAMQVRRTLPQRAKSLIGAWCFVDHYGPDDVSHSGGMNVPGHPHTGLRPGCSAATSNTATPPDTTPSCGPANST